MSNACSAFNLMNGSCSRFILFKSLPRESTLLTLAKFLVPCENSKLFKRGHLLGSIKEVLLPLLWNLMRLALSILILFYECSWSSLSCAKSLVIEVILESCLCLLSYWIIPSLSKSFWYYWFKSNKSSLLYFLLREFGLKRHTLSFGVIYVTFVVILVLVSLSSKCLKFFV